MNKGWTMYAVLRIRSICKPSPLSALTLSTVADRRAVNRDDKRKRSKNRKYNQLKLFPGYVRTPIDVEQRQSWIPLYTHPVDHPKVLIHNMEQKFLKEMMQIYERDGKVSREDLTRLYEEAIQNNEREHLSAQVIVDILSSFLSLYDLEWVKETVIPLMPTVTADLNLCSRLVLRVTICAYNSYDILQPDLNKFVQHTYKQLMDHPDDVEGEALSILLKDIRRTLCLSSRWREMIDEIHDDKYFTFLRRVLIRRALYEQDFRTAFMIFQNTVGDRTDDMLHDYERRDMLLSAKDFAVMLPDRENLQTLFHILNKADFEVDMDTASAILETWNNNLPKKRKGTFAVIDRGGRCSVCAQKMEEERPITAEEVKHLKFQFYEKSFVGGHKVFHIGDPKVVSDFLKWITSKKPYDLVIDGLNAFFSTYRDTDKATLDLRNVNKRQVLDLLDGGRKRGLIVTKRHMEFQIPRELSAVCDVYTVHPKVPDDVYTVYAALMSGPQCFVLSSDEFRDHGCLLVDQQDAYTINLFNRWQRLRKTHIVRDLYIIRGVQFNKRTVYKFSHHLQTSIRAQCLNGHWHIPVSHPLLDQHSPRLPYLQKWLCLPPISNVRQTTK